MENKDCTYTFRLTKKQKDDLFKFAKNENMKPSEYILNKIFSGGALSDIKRMRSILCEMKFDCKDVYQTSKITQAIHSVDFVLDNLSHVDDKEINF